MNMNEAQPLVVRSGTDGIQWPAITRPEAATALAMQFQLEQSQWWSAETLLRHQMGQLHRVLAHALESVPYYQQRFGDAGVSLGSELTYEDWVRLPLLKRPQLQDAGKAILSTRVPPAHGRVETLKTSGSTGMPVTIYATQLVGLFWQALTLREHLWHRRDLSAKLAAIRFAKPSLALPPDGQKYSGWGPATDVPFQTGPSVRLNIVSSTRQQAEYLVREDPDYLLTHPTILAELARYFGDHGMRLGNLREVRTLGETVSEETRQLCREAWGVPLVDMYSMVEAGYVALQCPKHEHYHVQSESVLVEILDDDDRPCKPGEVGRVVLSSLHNFASPLIRYDLGDYAEVGAPCDCGRGLPVIKRIMGRTRNMLVMPSGERYWPVLDLKAHGQFGLIRQLQMIQKTPEDLEVRLVTKDHFGEKQETELVAALQQTLGYPFRIRFVYMESIPRSKGGKFEGFISDIAAPVKR